MSRMPRITVVTPSFNQGAYVEETIESVLGQGYPNLQYIVMDGGSKDRTVEVLRKYSRHLAYWESRPDRGQAHAINRGLARADGDIWAYLNSDDRYVPGALARVAEAFGGAGVEWVGGGVRNFGEGRKETITRYVPEEGSEGWVRWFFENPVHQPGAFWSARLGRGYGPFAQTLRYTFDFDFFMRLRFQANMEPVVLPEVVAEFRLHGESKTIREGVHFEEEFARCRKDFLSGRADLAPAVLRWKRRRDGERMQWEALKLSGEGRTLGAVRRWAGSVRMDPRSLWERRTLGCLRRIMLRRGSEWTDPAAAGLAGGALERV